MGITVLWRYLWPHRELQFAADPGTHDQISDHIENTIPSSLGQQASVVQFSRVIFVVHFCSVMQCKVNFTVKYIYV